MTRATRSPGLVARIGQLLFVAGSMICGVVLVRSIPACPMAGPVDSSLPAGCVSVFLSGGPSVVSVVVSAPWTLPGLTLALAGVLLVALDEARAVGGALVSDLHQWLLEVSHREH
jgi:hypothetical protein